MQGSTFILEDYKALGTVWYIESFSMTSFETTKEIRDRMTKEIKSFQDKYSRFEQSSLLNTLNREKKIIFDYDLYTMLLQGEKWRELSGGVFDIAIKSRLESLGYGAGVNTEENKGIEVLGVEPDKNIHISRVSKVDEYILWNSNLQIDLGGIGKGYLIDKLTNLLKEEYGLQYFLINGGGDIFATSDNGKAIELLLEHPTELGMYIGKVLLKDESLCVSSSFKRAWKQGGIKRNHLLDTQGEKLICAASFVISKGATKTDILATTWALLAHLEDQVLSMSSVHQAEYMIINEDGEVFATKRFKQALNTL